MKRLWERQLAELPIVPGINDNSVVMQMGVVGQFDTDPHKWVQPSSGQRHVEGASRSPASGKASSRRVEPTFTPVAPPPMTNIDGGLSPVL
jgi:hypothetical protein